MMIDNRLFLHLALALALLGAALAFVAWAFRLVPGWTIPVAAIGTPILLYALFALLFAVVVATDRP